MAQSYTTRRNMGQVISVSVVYASRLVGVYNKTVELALGEDVCTAIKRSGLLACCPEIDLEKNRVGIFNRLCGLETIPNADDRIEIYRPLLNDPKVSRRRRQARHARPTQ